MEDIKDDIGQMFQKTFESYKPEPEPGDWAMIAGSVQKINFFKFNPIQFNVYYASTILFCFLTCLSVGSHYTYSHLFGAHEKTNLSDLMDSTNNRILNNNTILEDKYLHSSKDSVQIKTENNEVNIKTIKPKEQSLSQNRPETMDPTTQSNKTENVISVDTLQKPLQIKQTLTSTDSTKLKKKRILYITKQDTIIQFDTLHSPKQKRKRFK